MIIKKLYTIKIYQYRKIYPQLVRKLINDSLILLNHIEIKKFKFIKYFFQFSSFNHTIYIKSIPFYTHISKKKKKTIHKENSGNSEIIERSKIDRKKNQLKNDFKKMFV